MNKVIFVMKCGKCLYTWKAYQVEPQCPKCGSQYVLIEDTRIDTDDTVDQVVKKEGGMLIINYTKDGNPISDFGLEEYVQRLMQSCESSRGDGVINLKVSTENIFWCVKCMVAEEKLDHNKIVLMFNGSKIEMNKYGAIQDWPKDFMSTSTMFGLRCNAAAIQRNEQDRERRMKDNSVPA